MWAEPELLPSGPSNKNSFDACCGYISGGSWGISLAGNFHQTENCSTAWLSVSTKCNIRILKKTECREPGQDKGLIMRTQNSSHFALVRSFIHSCTVTPWGKVQTQESRGDPHGTKPSWMRTETQTYFNQSWLSNFNPEAFPSIHQLSTALTIGRMVR